MFEQLTLFRDIPIGEKIEYISCGKKYKGVMQGYAYNGKYIECTTNQKGYSGVLLHIENKGRNWFTK